MLQMKEKNEIKIKENPHVDRLFHVFTSLMILVCERHATLNLYGKLIMSGNSRKVTSTYLKCNGSFCHANTPVISC